MDSIASLHMYIRSQSIELYPEDVDTTPGPFVVRLQWVIKGRKDARKGSKPQR